MIIFVGGIIGAGKSTVAKGLATHFNFPYYDVDEVKKRVFRQDPNYEKNIAEGIPFSDELRRDVFKRVFSDLEKLVVESPHIVVDETLHKRDIRQPLYAEAERIAGGFIVIWVQAREDVILKRLGARKRDNHFLDDPLPLHNAFKREFEEYDRCIIDCHNNGSVEETISDLVTLFDRAAVIAKAVPCRTAH
jgi:predicted kinase